MVGVARIWGNVNALKQDKNDLFLCILLVVISSVIRGGWNDVVRLL